MHFIGQDQNLQWVSAKSQNVLKKSLERINCVVQIVLHCVYVQGTCGTAGCRTLSRTVRGSPGPWDLVAGGSQQTGGTKLSQGAQGCRKGKYKLVNIQVKYIQCLKAEFHMQNYGQF